MKEECYGTRFVVLGLSRLGRSSGRLRFFSQQGGVQLDDQGDELVDDLLAVGAEQHLVREMDEALPTV